MDDYAPVGRVLLLADDPEAVGAVRTAARQIGCRILPVSLHEGAERVAEPGGFDAIFLYFRSADLERGGPLLKQIDEAGERFRCALHIPRPAIDDFAAIGLAPARRMASQASQEELREMLGWLMEVEQDHFHGAERGLTRLQQLSQDAERLAAELAAISELAAPRDGAEDRPFDAARVRAIIRARRVRDQFFGPDLFADPAWDMLLDLMAARLEGQHVAVSSLCIAAAVPATTALRWIKVLTEKGLLVRVADPQDGRRIHIELADHTAAALDAYFRTAHRMLTQSG